MLLVDVVREGQVSAVLAALDAGSELDTADAGGWTALMVACRDGYAPIARLLIERGARLDTIGPGGETALGLAWRPAGPPGCSHPDRGASKGVKVDPCRMAAPAAHGRARRESSRPTARTARRRQPGAPTCPGSSGSSTTLRARPYGQALASFIKTYGADNPTAATMRANQAVVLRQLGDLSRARGDAR